jgi:hypothetical protein
VQEGSTLATGIGREGGLTIGGFQQGGAPFIEGRFIAGVWGIPCRFEHLGFTCRALAMISSAS